ncbi:low molecular weight phosphatase family protein [Maribacter sp. ACAM166]|uniref:arsenate-mycothiol transferase ArsC n=1 Tax=Maribacter sp. ACAM166 TaxID=2508996 RepID=UPI002016CF53|nr:protein-tyrosine-phosphatase [Maribacter sp. ACAM166]
MQGKKNDDEPINLNFVCTHNSRRSHLSQIWSQVMATSFQISNVTCYSGGTEATALFPKVLETPEDSGLKSAKISKGNKTVYAIKYGGNAHPIIGFSKTYDNEFNPSASFAAIMTYSDAYENCPFIPGTEKRLLFTFDDPKAFDGTTLQIEKHKERSLEIAEQLYSLKLISEVVSGILWRIFLAHLFWCCLVVG